MFGIKAPIPLLAVAVLLVVPAEATTTYYVGAAQETAFNTAVGGMNLLDPALVFSGTPGSTGLLNASNTGIDFLGFLFGSPLDFTVSGGKLTANDPDEITKVNFPVATTVYAFGLHITSTGGFLDRNWCIELTPSVCDFTVPNATVQFFGVVSSTPLAAPLFIRHQTGAATMVLTNFEAFDASAVPEPRTMLLIATGLAILGLVRRNTRPIA